MYNQKNLNIDIFFLFNLFSYYDEFNQLAQNKTKNVLQ